MTESRHPATEHIYRYFEYKHLPPKLAKVSRHFAITADLVIEWLPDSPELTFCLRQLLLAKDAAVRAALDLPDE